MSIMMLHRICIAAGILAAPLVLLVYVGPTWPADRPAAAPAAAFTSQQALEKDLQTQTAGLHGARSFAQGVLAIQLPRSDLWVQNDMGEIPTAAGIESRFYFFRCSCGKDKVVGRFALADYEVNGVLDALRAGGIQIVSLGSMFMGEKPRMMSLRFQGEGQASDLAKTLQTALASIAATHSSPGQSNPPDPPGQGAP
jgi:Domain of Unknown Function (DUF1259)